MTDKFVNCTAENKQELIFAAEKLNASDELTCVMTKDGEVIYKSEFKGVRPLMDGLKTMTNCVVADKVIGRAAALLCVLGSAKAVYAKLISEPAKEVLAENSIPFVFETSVERILNRDKTGHCPMESATMGIDNPKEAYEAICAKIRELSGK